MNLLELADRIEKLTEPCRETDARIWLALFDKPVMTDGGGFGPNARAAQYTQAREIWNDEWPYWGDAQQVRDVAMILDAPHYTASLDAAMTLVPEGWPITEFAYWPSVPAGYESERCCRLIITDLSHDGFGGRNRFKAQAATPALAITAASLRARAAPPLPTPSPGSRT